MNARGANNHVQLATRILSRLWHDRLLMCHISGHCIVVTTVHGKPAWQARERRLGSGLSVAALPTDMISCLVRCKIPDPDTIRRPSCQSTIKGCPHLRNNLELEVVKAEALWPPDVRWLAVWCRFQRLLLASNVSLFSISSVQENTSFHLSNFGTSENY